jgi:hypothetical protein
LSIYWVAGWKDEPLGEAAGFGGSLAKSLCAQRAPCGDVPCRSTSNATPRTCALKPVASTASRAPTACKALPFAQKLDRLDALADDGTPMRAALLQSIAPDLAEEQTTARDDVAVRIASRSGHQALLPSLEALAG